MHSSSLSFMLLFVLFVGANGQIFAASTIPTWTWCCVGIGGACVIVGAILALRAAFVHSRNKLNTVSQWSQEASTPLLSSGSKPPRHAVSSVKSLVIASIILFVVGSAFVGVSVGVAYATRFQTPFGTVSRGQTVVLSSKSVQTKKIVVETVPSLVLGEKLKAIPPSSEQPVLQVGEVGLMAVVVGSPTQDPDKATVLWDGSLLVSGQLFPEIEDSSKTNIAQTVSVNPTRTKFDFDGDRRADIAVVRQNSVTWYIDKSSDGQLFAAQFGLTGDIIVASDYTGDGKADVAVFRQGVWHALRSEDGSYFSTQFGQANDIPVPGDFDGDGKSDVAVFRPSTGSWYVLLSTTGQMAVDQYGVEGDIPQVGDYDGDGRDDKAIFRPSSNQWWIRRSRDGDVGAQFGSAGDIPVAADYTGDGKTDIAVYRPGEGKWFVLRSEDASFFAVQFGISTDLVAPADYDGDGKTDFGVFRPETGVWYILLASGGTVIRQFGQSSDVPVCRVVTTVEIATVTTTATTTSTTEATTTSSTPAPTTTESTTQSTTSSSATQTSPPTSTQAPTTTPYPIGTGRNTAVYLVTFSSNTCGPSANTACNAPPSLSAARAMFVDENAPVKRFFQMATKGQVWFNVRTENIIPVTINQVVANPLSLPSLIAGTANFQTRVYLVPDNYNCGNLAEPTVGFAIISGGDAWFRRMESQVAIHELGHNLGLHHSGALDGNGAFGEYWDVSSDMSVGLSWQEWPMRGLSASQLWRIGALPAARILVASAPVQGLVLQPLASTTSTGYLAAKLTLAGNEVWVELREKVQQDADLDLTLGDYIPGYTQLTGQVYDVLLVKSVIDSAGRTKLLSIIPVGASRTVFGNVISHSAVKGTFSVN